MTSSNELTFPMTSSVPADVTSTHLPTTTELQLPSIGVSNHVNIIYYMIGTIGILGNLTVLTVLSSSRSMRRFTTNLFILNQSIIDLLAASFLLASTPISSNKVPWTGTRGELYCRMWLNKLPLWSLMVSSTYNLAAMTLERYLAVLHPIWHKVSFNIQLFTLSPSRSCSPNLFISISPF